MTAATIRPPMPLELGPEGGQRAVCQRCGNRTGRHAWGHYRLRGLYCGSECVFTALSQYDLVALNGVSQ